MSASTLSHTRYVLINRLATPLGAFVILILIGRHSDQLLGEYAIVMTFYFIMQMLPLLGLTTFVMREVARSPGEAGKYFNNVAFLSLLGCVAVDLLVYGFFQAVSYSAAVRQAVVLSGILIFPGIIVFISELILMSLHRAKPVAQVALTENAARVALSVAALEMDTGLVGVVAVMLATKTGAFLAYLLLMKRGGIVGQFGVLDRKLLRRVWRVLPTFLSGAFLFILLNRLDFVVLSVFEVVEVIGYYAIGYRLLEISTIILTALIMALFPTIAKKFIGARSRYRITVRNTVLLFVAGLALVAFAGALFADEYVYLLFRNQYPEPVLLTQLFMVGFLIIGIDFVASGILMASDMQNRDVRATAIGGAWSSLLLVSLVPVYSLYGALFAKVSATFVQALFKFRYLREGIGDLFRPGDLWRIAVVAGMPLILIPLFVDSPFLSKVLGVLLVGLVLMPVVAWGTGLFRPWHLVRYYRRPAMVRDVTNAGAMLDVVLSDTRHRARVFRANRVKPVTGGVAVLLYRLARFFHLRGARRSAAVLYGIYRVLFGFNVTPDTYIGPGLVLVGSTRVSLALEAGKNLVCEGPVRWPPASHANTQFCLANNVTLNQDLVDRGLSGHPLATGDR